MAKKVQKLDFVDIVMGARADVIKEAYEARLKIDDLLDAREAAYLKIAEIEERVEDIVGVTGDFVFPAPPLPVAGIPRPTDTNRPKAALQQMQQDSLEEKLDVLKDEAKEESNIEQEISDDEVADDEEQENPNNEQEILNDEVADAESEVPESEENK